MTRHSGKGEEMRKSLLLLDNSSLEFFELGVSHSNVHLDGFNSCREKRNSRVLHCYRTSEARELTHSIIGRQNHNI